MTDRYPGALVVSLTMHALVAGLLWLFAYAAAQSRQEVTKVFELVAGEGDNFAATVAPARGEPGGIKLDMPAPPEPVKTPEVAPQPTPQPATVVPIPPPAKPVEKPLPNLSKMIERKVDRAEAKTKKELAKQHEVEAKEAAKKLTKEEFDKLNKKKVAATPAGPPKVAKIDAEGIRGGVTGGSTENKTGGAGGRALTRDEGTVMEAYYALLQQRLRAALDKPPGLPDTLITVIQVRLEADGSLTGARILKASGSPEFDSAAMAAVAIVQMPPRPDKKSEVLTLPFRTKEPTEG